MPTSAVNTTSDITRGFSSARKSCTPALLGSTRAASTADGAARSAVRSVLGLISALLDPRQDLELVERRRRRQRPFQRGRARAPRVVGCTALLGERLGDA